MKPLVAAVALMLLSSRAYADPLATYGQNFQSYIGSISLEQVGDYIPDVYLPDFSQNLGTLQAVQLGLSMSISAMFTYEPPGVPNPPPSSVNFTFGLRLFGGGEYSFSPVFQSATPRSGPDGTLSAQASAGFNQQFFASNASYFESSCANDFYCSNTDFFIGPYVLSSINNSETQDFESVFFDLSETFYYASATDVPEPASAGLLLVGCIASFALAKCRRRRNEHCSPHAM